MACEIGSFVFSPQQKSDVPLTACASFVEENRIRARRENFVIVDGRVVDVVSVKSVDKYVSSCCCSLTNGQLIYCTEAGKGW